MRETRVDEKSETERNEMPHVGQDNERSWCGRAGRWWSLVTTVFRLCGVRSPSYFCARLARRPEPRNSTGLLDSRGVATVRSSALGQRFFFFFFLRNPDFGLPQLSSSTLVIVSFPGDPFNVLWRVCTISNEPPCCVSFRPLGPSQVTSPGLPPTLVTLITPGIHGEAMYSHFRFVHNFVGAFRTPWYEPSARLFSFFIVHSAGKVSTESVQIFSRHRVVFITCSTDTFST